MRTRFNKALLNGVVATRARRMRSEPTDAERRLWERLRHDAFGVKFKRQYAIGGYITDFCCPRHKLIIELDGGQHMENSNYDEQRSQELAKNGFRVLRFWNTDVMGNLDGVIESIEEALHPLP